MNSTQIIIWMIIACSIALCGIIFVKPIKTVSKIFFNALVGTILLIPLNYILAPVGFFVGINLFTIIVMGVLGFPGVIMLYLCQIFI